MNRKKLDALLSAGIITAEQHAAALKSINGLGLVTQLPELQLEVAGHAVQLSTDEATGAGVLEGIITEYETYIPSHGMVLHAGSLTPRDPIDRVKLMRDHDHAQPVGYMLAIDEARETASFQVAPAELERVTQEFDDKLRDGLSVGLTITEYEIDDEWVLHVNQAILNEVSLCALPALVGAGVTSVAAALATQRKEHRTMNRAQLAAALAAGSITQEQHDAALAALETLEAAQRPTATPAAPVDAATAAGPELQSQQPAPHVQVNERLSLRDVGRRLAEAHNNLSNTHDPIAAVQLALQDVIPADDDGNAFVNREDWVGEVWRATDDSRPWIDSLGVPGQMTRLKGRGWRWGILSGDPEVESDGTPQVAEYAGAKTDVPSNKIGTLEQEFDSFRMAGGWDIDRAYIDFSDEEFWTAFFEAATRNYKLKSNIKVRTLILALATDTPTADVAFGTVGIQGVLKQLRRDIRKTPGGQANRVFLGDDLFDALEDLPEDDQPLWLRNATVGLGDEEGTASVNKLQIVNDPALTAKQAVVFDSRALVFKERTPFWVKAENIPKGGIDAGVFSYGRLEPHDPRLVIKRTY